MHHLSTPSFKSKIFLKKFLIKDSIYIFDNFDDTTKKIKNFYNQYSFPNYKLNHNKFDILELGNNSYLKHLKKLTFPKKLILDVGSGTCQFSAYFAIGSNSQVFALDPAINSLTLGKDFCKKNNIQNITFVNGSIFDNIFKKEIFDFVFCSGSLHHTHNPYLAFQKSVTYLKKDGYVLVGLYNSFARKRIQNFFLKFLSNKILKKIDKISHIKDDNQKNAWIKDQYYNPLESTHTICEVLKWFKKNNIEPICGLPTFNNLTFEELEKNGSIARSKVYGKLHLILKQIKFRFSHYASDSGLFVMLGRKK